MEINLKIRKATAPYEFWELDFLEIENQKIANELIEKYNRVGKIEGGQPMASATPANTAPDESEPWYPPTTYTTTVSQPPHEQLDGANISNQTRCKFCNGVAKKQENAGKSVINKNGEVIMNKAGYPVKYADYKCKDCGSEAWNQKSGEFYWKQNTYKKGGN